MKTQTVMTTYKTKDGFQMITHSEMGWDEHSKNFPVVFIIKTLKASAYLTYIRNTTRETRLVYFVTGHNGDEFGQFKTAEEAISILVNLN